MHVIANRVDPESGKAAGLNRSQLKLSKWAEEYERGRGEFRCPQRERGTTGSVRGGSGWWTGAGIREGAGGGSG